MWSVILLAILLSDRLAAFPVCYAAELCTQKDAYEVNGVVSLIVNATLCDLGKLSDGEECVICIQPESTRQIHCATMHSRRMLFSLDNISAGLQGVDVVSYVRKVGDRPRLDYANLTVYKSQYYVRSASSEPLPLVMEIMEPSFGSIAENDLYIGLQFHTISKTTYTGSEMYVIAADGSMDSGNRPAGMQFQFQALGLFEGTYPTDLSHLASTDIEPASWFYSIMSMVPVDADKTADGSGVAVGYTSTGYIEFVLRPDQIQSQRRFVHHPTSTAASDAKTSNSDHSGRSVNSVGGSDGDSVKHSLAALTYAVRVRAQQAQPIPAPPPQQPSGFLNSILSVFGSTTTTVITGTTATTSASTATSPSTSAAKAGKVNICIWSSDHMDGQKRIWLDQTEHLDADRFEFTWLLSLEEGKTMADLVAAGGAEDGARVGASGDQSAAAGAQGKVGGKKTSLISTLQQVLRRRQNGRVIDSPYNGLVLEVEALEENPGDGRPPLAQSWDGDEMAIYRYAHDSLLRANFTIDAVRPQWCRRFYSVLRDALPPLSCTAIVYGNERGFSADVLVTDAARILGIPTVAELLNLYVHRDVLPTVMAAPSTFAVEHESIQSVLRESFLVPSSRVIGVDKPLAVVIPPGVDTARFDPAIYRKRQVPSGFYVGEGVYSHPACRAGGKTPLGDDGKPVKPCVVIGFVARLSPEKNVGLFLQAAHAILRLHSFARFTVVGDGVLRASLEELTARLGISWAVHFTGWVGAEQLPAVLAGMDIVVNPSLRAWSETFCIANVEAMSMEVPLVTFAVGGVGEYVSDPLLHTAASRSPVHNSTEFSVSENAVVLNIANPTVLANAVYYLIQSPNERRRLGRAGRKTVLQHFSTSRQMKQYEQLYELLRDA